MVIVSIGSKLLKTVELLAVRLNLNKLRVKKETFWLKNKFLFFVLCNPRKSQKKGCHPKSFVQTFKLKALRFYGVGAMTTKCSPYKWFL